MRFDKTDPLVSIREAAKLVRERAYKPDELVMTPADHAALIEYLSGHGIVPGDSPVATLDGMTVTIDDKATTSYILEARP